MKIAAILTAALAGTGWGASVSGRAASLSSARVTVCMKMGFDVQPLYSAEKLAARMFAEAGVATEWPMKEAACAGSGVIVVTLSYLTRPSDHPEAWAYALPYEGAHIVVFWDRIQQKFPTGRASVLLAHVLVHEIAHILQGVSRHSDTGIMKASWDLEDLFQMARKPLGFTAEDIDLIRRGVAARFPGALLATK